MSPAPKPFTNHANSVVELETLVGMHVVGETPEIFWEDSHGLFQFASESEARVAVGDPYYQQFLPAVDWAQTVIREAAVFRQYCSDPAGVWLVVEKASEKYGPLSIERRQGRWLAVFGKGPKTEARMAPVAICLAALDASGVVVNADHERIDAELSRLGDSRSHGPDAERERRP